jgi:hypothetical protein
MENWLYEDAHGEQQGPYPTAHMRAWHEQGYFQPSLRIAHACANPHFVPLVELWSNPESAFSAAPDLREEQPDTMIGPAEPPRGWKRRREEPQEETTATAPPIHVPSATLAELFQDRLPASVCDPWPPPPRRFEHYERVDGSSSMVNVLEGLALHYEVVSAGDQRHLFKFVQRLKELGAAGELTGRTYTAPSKWRRGNGRITVQLGCCYVRAEPLTARARRSCAV